MAAFCWVSGQVISVHRIRTSFTWAMVLRSAPQCIGSQELGILCLHFTFSKAPALTLSTLLCKWVTIPYYFKEAELFHQVDCKFHKSRRQVRFESSSGFNIPSVWRKGNYVFKVAVNWVALPPFVTSLMHKALSLGVSHKTSMCFLGAINPLIGPVVHDQNVMTQWYVLTNL